MKGGAPGSARAAPVLLGCLAILSRCNLYEARSLDLFQPEADLAAECRTAQDCPRDRKFCDQDSCVQCLVDSDCDRRHPACVGNACVECRSADDCGPRQSCNGVLAVCAPTCTSPSDCAGPETAHCSTELALCVQCLADADCSTPRDPVCGRGGRCVGCLSDADCKPDAGKLTCNVASQRCEECASDSQCAPDQTCDLAAARCTPMAMPPPMPGPPGVAPPPP
jgi:hypothetical protein